MEASEFQTVCRVGDVPEGEGKPVQVGNKIIALFCVNGQYHAIDDVCPHMGASLSGGYQEDGIVTCPWHGYQYNLRTGNCLTVPDAELERFAVTVLGDTIYVDVPTGH